MSEMKKNFLEHVEKQYEPEIFQAVKKALEEIEDPTEIQRNSALIKARNDYVDKHFGTLSENTHLMKAYFKRRKKWILIVFLKAWVQKAKYQAK